MAIALTILASSATRRELIGTAGGLLAAAVIGARVCADVAPVALTPEMFGARGDGKTNDSAAFARLAAEVARQGGGRIVLRRAVYVVGEQHKTLLDPQYAYAPVPLLAFEGLEHALTIEGNGATMRCAPNLRFGSFDRLTQAPHRHKMPFLDRQTVATPYRYMIAAIGCKGPVAISDIELDGNLAAMIIGSGFGDTGIQIEGSGLFLRNNEAAEILLNIHSHHHPQDGVMIDGLSHEQPALRVTRHATNLRCEDNARQGLSLIGGRNWIFQNCAFNRTGRAGLSSSPSAGVDLEAEGGKLNRGHRFIACRFVDNAGCGMAADSGDSADVTFVECTFVGTTTWSLWSAKPYFRFERCTIVGTAVRPFGDADARRATQFVECLFTDDPTKSPSGKVYREGRTDGPLFDLGDAVNVLFDRCRMIAVAGAVLPWSTGAIYRSCVMRQGTRSTGLPRGTYEGHTTIDGRVELYGSKFRGTVTINGQTQTL